MSALALFPPSFSGRANRGLLVEARAPEEAGASLATGTERTSASALAAIEPTNGAIRPEEGRVWFGVVEVEGAGVDTALLVRKQRDQD